MKITFEADLLKRFLVEAGIDSNDAKAIVYDLMLCQDNPSGINTSKIIPRVQPTQPTQEPKQPDPDRTVIHKPVNPTFDFQETEEEPEPIQQPDRSKVRIQKRMNFEQFGGAAKPLRD